MKVKISENFSVDPGNQSLRVLTLDEARVKCPDVPRGKFERYGGKKLKLYTVSRRDNEGKGDDFRFSFSRDGDDTYNWTEKCFKEYWESLPVVKATPAKKVSTPKPISPVTKAPVSAKKKNNMSKFFKMYLLMTLLGSKKQ